MKLWLVIAALALALSACVAQEIPVSEEPDFAFAVVVDAPAEPTRALDILFVVDNTIEMEAKQRELSASFARLLSHFEFVDGGMPDLHVGVVSTDLGIELLDDTPVLTADRRQRGDVTLASPSGSADASAPLAECSITGGDRGVLQNAPRTDSCTGPVDRFIRDVSVGGELREKNYVGSLADTFSCISELGTSGCAFEQPLEAMRRALDGSLAANDGFLRPEAALAIVILTNEDDCSIDDPRFYDPTLDGEDELTEFRCFRKGVECVGDDVFTAGTQTGCAPRDDSEYLHEVGEYKAFLDQLKFDPSQVVVTGMIGDSSVVEVELTVDGQPVLAHSCEDENLGAAYPAVRLQGFLDSLHGDGESSDEVSGEVSSLCRDEAPFSILDVTARQIRKALGTRCLEGPIVDVEPYVAGLQPQCIVEAVAPDGGREEIAACDDPIDHLSSGPVPCYAIKTGGTEGCGDFETQLALHVNWGGPDASPPLGTRTVAECLIDQRLR